MAIQNRPQFYIYFKNYLSATRTHNVIVREGLPLKVMIVLSVQHFRESDSLINLTPELVLFKKQRFT